ncbi:transglycosylase domain-containing protein [Glycomyces sp. NPDC046736]|uniref:transglycosylase domain-containing protein n=1 Tax=Glycomyces sp. NPDC046736 TaxID=3155615 RepID=UPI0033DD561C
MSDYGYRPAPPPEDPRGQGRGAGQGRAYNNGPDPRGRSAAPGWGSDRRQGAPQPGRGSARPPQSQYGTPPSGSAPVGRGSASVGRGSASVGGASGSASVGPNGRSGRASVGSASVGSASVGSASVGSASVGGRTLDRDKTPERAGRAGAGGRRRAGSGPGKGDEGDKKKRKRFGRKMLATLIALAILFVTGVTIVASYFFVDVGDVNNIARAGESSTFTFADGNTEAGGYGETLRLQADPNEIPQTVKDALIATEDRKFMDHSGVDFTRTMGALVNNLTGGDTQGASTITQQYAGMIMDIRDDISYDRKAREAAMAMKIENQYSKDQIITAYLNLAYFGRGATGIEAAAKVYFDKPLLELDYHEAAFIVMQVKSPNGLYDEYYNDVYNEEAALGRWNYSMNSMVETGALTQEQRDSYEMPTPINDFKSSGSWGGNTDVGFIVNELDGYVFDELYDRYDITPEMLGGAEGQNGGYKVVLTIDQDIQAALKATNSRGQVAVKMDGDTYLDKDGNPVDSRSEAALDTSEEGYAQFINDNDEAALKEYKEYMMSAMVAIDPATGAVLGYYGGDDGFGVDKAGAESPHPPSSTMKMVTAATAIQNGDSIESWFNADSPRNFDSLKNDDETCIGGGDYPNCAIRSGSQSQRKLELTLEDSVVSSKNTPMYSIAEQYGADEILRYANAMGLTQMSQSLQVFDSEGGDHSPNVNYELTPNGEYILHGQAVDAEGNPVTDVNGNWDTWALVQTDENCVPEVNLDGAFILDTDGVPQACPIGGPDETKKTDPFYYHLAFGQYPTSVKDMAAIYATIANDGLYEETHYIAKVFDYRGEEVEPKRDLKSDQVIAAETARDLQYVGAQIKGENTVGEDLTRDYFGKTGTWEASGEDENGNKYEAGWNAHAWYVGAIPQLSIASWVGNLESESDPISGPDGSFNNVFGGNTAYPAWLVAMHKILDVKDGDEAWEPVEWGGKALNGSPTTWDLDKAGFRTDGEYCAANGDKDSRCGADDEEKCEDGSEPGAGGVCPEDGNEDDNDQPTPDPTDPTTPGDGESSEECGDSIFLPDCEETPSTDPSTPIEETSDWGRD